MSQAFEDLIRARRDRLDRSQMQTALQAIIARHKPIDIEPDDTICHECSWQLPNGKYFGKIIEYPCATLQDIEDARGGEDG